MKIEIGKLKQIISEEVARMDEQYVVQPGDTMYDIAQDLGVGLSDLIAANPQFSAAKLPDWTMGDRPGEGDYVGATNRNPNWIYPGDQLSIPGQEGGVVPREPDGQPGAGTQPPTSGNLGDVVADALGEEFVDACTQEKIQMLNDLIMHVSEVRDQLSQEDGE